MWAYEALLRLYPASFRAEYGGEMCALFARRRRDAKGPLGILVLWGRIRGRLRLRLGLTLTMTIAPAIRAVRVDPLTAIRTE